MGLSDNKGSGKRRGREASLRPVRMVQSLNRKAANLPFPNVIAGC